MLQYIIIACDGTDAEATKRRMKMRPFHSETVTELNLRNQFIMGGTSLNEESKMIGSMMVVQLRRKNILFTE